MQNLKTNKMRFFLFWFIGLFFINHCNGQKMPSICKEVVELEAERGSIYDPELLITDSLEPKLTLIFERGFDDTIYVFVNKKIWEVRKIQTSKALGVDLEILTIDYSNFKRKPLISLLLKEKQACLSFYPKKGKQLLYLNFLSGTWFAEFSNVEREYR